jgi:hypothetical protein
MRAQTNYVDGRLGDRPSRGALLLNGGQQGGSAKVFILSAIDRIEAVVIEETQALRTSMTYDLERSNNRKSHSIVDFNNAVRNLTKSDLDSEIVRRLEVMRRHLRENHTVIQLHLEAAKEISALLSEAMQDAESDGTYSRSASNSRLSA